MRHRSQIFFKIIDSSKKFVDVTCTIVTNPVFYQSSFSGRFDEDGSFIGQYGTLRKQKAGVPVVVTNSAAFASAKAAASVSPGTYV
jgi:hypothetical protein